MQPGIRSWRRRPRGCLVRRRFRPSNRIAQSLPHFRDRADHAWWNPGYPVRIRRNSAGDHDVAGNSSGSHANDFDVLWLICSAASGTRSFEASFPIPAGSEPRGAASLCSREPASDACVGPGTRAPGRGTSETKASNDWLARGKRAPAVKKRTATISIQLTRTPILSPFPISWFQIALQPNSQIGTSIEIKSFI